VNISVEVLPLPDVLLVHSRRLEDERGYFMETWSKDAFSKLGLHYEFVQENQSRSARRNTLRGLHFQIAPFQQAKLVRVLTGRIFEVVVDLRRDSLNFRKWHGVTLSSQDGAQMLIPRGFAHGFVALDDQTLVTYKVDAPYSPAHERGIRWNDPTLGVRWPIDPADVILSDRDRDLPLIGER